MTLDGSLGKASATLATGDDPNAGDIDTDASGPEVNGCASVSAGLDVNAGADASFFDLFDANKKVSLFKQDFDLFKVTYCL